MYVENVEDNIIKSFLLYCLLEAMSRVSNTAGVQAAFLKKLKQRAEQKFVVNQEAVIYNEKTKAFTSNILVLLKDKEFRKSFKEEVLYIDPPYNSRQYGPNYHLYETLVRYDNPELKEGKTGLRDWSDTKSDFCSKKTCLQFLKDIIESTTAKHIFVSYNTDGLMTRDEIENFILENFEDIFISVHIIKQRRFKSDSGEDRNYNKSLLKELLF
jgi:adenine-specific DNA-methyltransferase